MSKKCPPSSDGRRWSEHRLRGLQRTSDSSDQGSHHPSRRNPHSWGSPGQLSKRQKEHSLASERSLCSIGVEPRGEAPKGQLGSHVEKTFAASGTSGREVLRLPFRHVPFDFAALDFRLRNRMCSCATNQYKAPVTCALATHLNALTLECANYHSRRTL